MIILLGERIVNYVYLIGVMYGISIATTGFPFNMIESENISSKERSKYLGYATVASEIMSLIVPILTIQSYQVAAILILVFLILKLLLSFGIKNVNVQKEKVNIKEFYSRVKKDTTLKRLYAIEFSKDLIAMV